MATVEDWRILSFMRADYHEFICYFKWISGVNNTECQL
jgi:hypothetical protein